MENTKRNLKMANYLASGETVESTWEKFYLLRENSDTVLAETYDQLVSTLNSAKPGAIINFTEISTVNDEQITRAMYHLRNHPGDVGVSLSGDVSGVKVIDDECQIPFLLKDVQERKNVDQRLVTVLWQQKIQPSQGD